MKTDLLCDWSSVDVGPCSDDGPCIRESVVCHDINSFMIYGKPPQTLSPLQIWPLRGDTPLCNALVFNIVNYNCA